MERGRGQERKFRFRDTVGAEARQQALGSSYGHLILPRGLNVFTPELDEVSLFDILPYKVKDEHLRIHPDKARVEANNGWWYKRPFWTHRNIGPKKERIVCPTSVGKRCCVCSYRDKKIAEGSTRDDVSKFSASQRCLCIIVPIEHKKYSRVPHLFDIAFKNFHEQLLKECKLKQEYSAFPEPSTDGFTLQVRFGKASISGISYAVAERIDFVPRKSGYDQDFLDKIPSLDDMLSVLPTKELEAKFFEIEGEEPEEQVEVVVEGNENHSHEKEWPKDLGNSRSESDCIACEGTGINSKGNTCRICAGDGKKREESPMPAENKVEREKQTAHKEDSPKEHASGGKCPHGHVFGKDNEEYTECGKCILWDSCLEERSNLG